MSYESMAREEFGCDFPNGCEKNFDTTDGARVAAIRDGDIVAFCHEHSVHLIAKGVNLRVLKVVRKEWNALHGRKSKPELSELEARREQEFIASLK